MHFSLIQLQYFVEVANAGSFTVAARQIRVVQPTLSSSIKQLEESLGYDVFERVPRRGVRLTRRGRRFYDEANKLLRQADTLEKFVRNRSETLTGALRLGIYQPMSVFRTPQLLRAFHEAHPDVLVDVREGSQERLVQLLNENRVDVVVSYALTEFAQWDVETLTTIPPHAIVGTRHALAGQQTVTLKRLAEEPLVLLDLPYTGDYYLGLFDAQDLTPNVAYRIEGYETVRSMVAEGFGVSVLSHRPQHSHTYVGEGVRVLEIEGANQPVAVQLVKHPGMADGTVIKEFAKVARQVIGGAK